MSGFEVDGWMDGWYGNDGISQRFEDCDGETIRQIRHAFYLKMHWLDVISSLLTHGILLYFEGRRYSRSILPQSSLSVSHILPPKQFPRTQTTLLFNLHPRLCHTRLRGKRTNLIQTLNPAQQKLHLPICGGRLILRYHMSTHENLDPCQPPLRMRDSHCACSSRGSHIKFSVVGDIEIGVRGRLKALFTGPCHILDCEEGAIFQ